MMSVDGDVFWLTMVEDRSWATLDASFPELREKTNFYISAAQDPTFTTQIREASGKRLGVRVMCADAPTPEAVHILGLIRGCEHFGLRFAVRLLGDGSEITIEPGEIAGINPSPSSNEPRQKKPWWKFGRA